VQELALIMYDWHQEHVVKPGERLDMVRSAVLASGRSSIDNLFPEYTPAPTAESLLAEEDPMDVVSTAEPEDALAFIKMLDGEGSLSFSDMNITFDGGGDPDGLP
jgi:hypothetical protein